MKILKLILLILCFSFLLISCMDENCNCYQGMDRYAIYTFDFDSNNIVNVYDTFVNHVQFIPNSDRILYCASRSLYAVNVDGSGKDKIDLDFEIFHPSSIITMNGERCFVIGTDTDWRFNSDIYEIDLTTESVSNISNSDSCSFSSLTLYDNFLICTLRDKYNKSLILQYGLESAICDTIFADTLDSEIYYALHNPTSEEIYFSMSGDSITNGIYRINTINDEVSFVSDAICGGDMYFPIDGNRLIYSNGDIYEINTITGEIITLADGKNPDFFENLMIYSTSNDPSYSEIRTLNLNTYDDELVLNQGRIATFSQDGSKIVYEGVSDD